MGAKWRHGAPKGHPKGPERVQKVDFLRYLEATGAPQGPPEVHMVPFGKDLASFWSEIGHILDVFWTIWDQPWTLSTNTKSFFFYHVMSRPTFCIILGCFLEHFGSILGVFWVELRLQIAVELEKSSYTQT